MQKKFALILSLCGVACIAQPVFASPHIVSKKQLPVPKLSTAVIQKMSTGAYSSKFEGDTTSTYRLRTSTKEITVPKFLYTATLDQEITCDDTTYRKWNIEPDLNAMERLYRTKIDNVISTANDTVVFESKKGNTSTYIRRAYNSGVNKGPWPEYGSDDATFFGCQDSDVVIQEYNNNIRASSEFLKLIILNSNTIDQPSKWTPSLVRNSEGHAPMTDRLWDEPVTIDGIEQLPGVIYIDKNGPMKEISDSRIAVRDPSNRQVRLISPPWYKNFENPGLGDNEFIVVKFYKTANGFAVDETHQTDTDKVYPPHETNVYATALSGDTSYTATQQAPAISVAKTMFFTEALDSPSRSQGLIAYASNRTYPELWKVLLHVFTQDIQSTRVNIVSQTSSRVRLRYVFTTRKGMTQYWESELAL